MSKFNYYLFGALFLGLFAMASCAKTYNCECQDDSGHITNSDISEGSEEDSKASCKAMEYDHYDSLGGQVIHTYQTCDLK